VRRRADDIAAFFMDGLPAMKFIQSINAEAREANRLQVLNRSYLGDLLHLQLTNYVATGVPGLLILISTAAVFVIGGHQVIEKTLTLGSLIAFSAYLARATGPVQTLLGLYVGFLRTRVSLSRVLELTTIPPAVVSAADPRSLPANAKGLLVLEDVHFQYAIDRAPILKNTDLQVAGGTKIGLIGPSGVGKSTVIDLLHRHYDPGAGRILFDGVDLRDLDLGELRRRVAVVAQDTFLIAGTLAENIRYAAPGASDKEVDVAVRLAQLDRFVAELPDGLETRVGWRGTALSGGQRQRVAIARAVLQEPLILILDEATSAVDTEVEAQIVAAIDKLFADRTRIVISHRAAALIGCDRVVRIADGRIEPVDREVPVMEAAE
jgi:ATP-binding cassette subfamily B protein